MVDILQYINNSHAGFIIKLFDAQDSTKDGHAGIDSISGLIKVVGMGTVVYVGMDLIDPGQGMKDFHAFLSKEFAAENLDFWFQAAAFEISNYTNAMRDQFALDLFNLFIKNSAEKQVNLPGKIFHNIQSAVVDKRFSTTMFSEAKIEIGILMERNFFKRFRNTSEEWLLFEKLNKLGQAIQIHKPYKPVEVPNQRKPRSS